MSRRAAVVLLLLVPATAHADGGSPLPGVRSVWIDYIFTVEQDYPEYEFYLTSSTGLVAAERLTVTPSNPVRVSGPGEDYRYKWATVYAVRKSLLAPFGDKSPPNAWFSQNAERVEMLDFRKSLLFTDNRERAEIVCRIERGPDGWRLVQVSENAGDQSVRWTWIAFGVLAAAGTIWLGFWFLKQLLRPMPNSPLSDRGPHNTSQFDGNYSPPS